MKDEEVKESHETLSITDISKLPLDGNTVSSTFDYYEVVEAIDSYYGPLTTPQVTEA